MTTTKISVTVDTETLDRIKQFLPGNFNLSAILNEALRDQLHRHEMLALLDEMDRDDPMSEADDEAGETLWRQIQSSSIPGRSRRSPGKKNAYGTRSEKR